MRIVFDSIEEQRRAANPFVIAITWLLVPVIAITSHFASSGGTESALGAVLFAIIASFAGAMMGSTTLGRSLTAVALMAEISLLVANGGAWQIDMHMAYFAGLGLLIVYADWAAILAAAATVAVHHLVLSYLIPFAVFPDGASLSRVILHAVILIIEAGSLIWVSANLNNIFSVSASSLALAERAAQEAKDANVATETARRAQAAAEEQQRRTEIDAIKRERELVSRSIGAGLAQLSAKNLVFRMTDDVPESYVQLQTDFNSAIAHLEAALISVATGARSLLANVDRIADATNDFSSRSEQQAASLEETTATLEEVAATVKRSAEGAAHASKIVGVIKLDAESSGEVVRKAVNAISRIEKSSQDIGQIIATIDEIAFQTNLLALNAGVEAARAGDAGKGFAVVASEVRALAQRSAEAAQQVKALVATSSSEVGQGVALISQTVGSLEKIVAQVMEIAGVVTDISAGSGEQAASLSEISVAIAQMNENTQKNATMAADTSVATSQLQSEVAELVDSIGDFQVGSAVRTPATAAKQRAIPVLKHVSRSSAAVRRTAAASAEEAWEEF